MNKLKSPRGGGPRYCCCCCCCPGWGADTPAMVAISPRNDNYLLRSVIKL